MNTRREEAILSVAGREPGTLGRGIVDLYAELTENHRELSESIGQNNENNERVERDLAGKANQSDVDNIYRVLRATAQALGGAVAAHDTAAQAVNNGTATAATVETARSATRAASQSVADCDRRIDALEDRMEDLELWRRETVDPALTRFNDFIENAERRTPQVPLIQQPPVREATVEERVEPQPVVHPPTQVQPTVERRLAEREVEEVHVHFVDRTIDIRHWSGLQWLLAFALAFIVGVVLGKVLADWSGNAIGWWNWLGFVVATVVGFCLGGLIGAAIDNARNRREAEHTERRARHTDDRDHHDHGRHDDHYDDHRRHGTVYMDEDVRAR
jgi:hypothetical protein